MGKNARSARGEIIDFDLIAITQALASAPAPMNVTARRDFIDEREGVKVIKGVPLKSDPVAPQTTLPEAMRIAIDAANESSRASKEQTDETQASS